MPKLILSMDGLVLKEFVLRKERTTIGRKATNDVQIDNLAISGEHAVITTILNDSFLEDRDSTNGTYVNGQPIKKHALRNGDVIELGKYHLKYFSEPAFGAYSSDPASARRRADAGHAMRGGAFEEEETQFLELGEVPPPPLSVPTEMPDDRYAVIRVLSGSNTGKELELRKTLTRVGRPGLQVAVISRRPQGYFITHVEGESRPTVNGESLNDSALRLRHRDVLEIAGTRMEFSLRD